MPSSASFTAHTGATYYKRITGSDLNLRVRSAYQELVLRIAQPGAALFDFGAGPGIDARFFAERGFTVDAYDVDPAMCEFFSAHCRDLIDSGRVTLDGGDYRRFLAGKSSGTGRRVDLIISNFAPLNQVDDLRELFAKFHALTLPNGRVLVSVLNPCFTGDMKSYWWWRLAPRLWREGRVFVPVGHGPPHTRRRLGDFRAQSQPYFSLTRVFRGLPANPGRHSMGIDLSRGGRHTWLYLATCQFMILLFERRD